MALHTDLPIYRTGCELVKLAVEIQAQMHRSYKRFLGEKIIAHCTDMLDLMALANASRGQERAQYVREVLHRVHAAQVLLRTAHELKCLATGRWARAIELLESIGKQGGGWYWLLRIADHSGYTASVTSKKGVIGCESPLHRCDASRSSVPQSMRLLCLRHHFLVARTGGPRGPAGSRKRCPVSHTRPSCRPCVRAGAVVVENRTAWRPSMAIVIPLPTAASSPIVQPQRRGRFPHPVVSIWRLREARRARDRNLAAARKQVDSTRHLISTLSDVLGDFRLKLAEEIATENRLATMAPDSSRAQGAA